MCYTICMDIISKTEAVSNNLKFYSTGKPCAKGHTSDRYSSSGACVQCKVEAARDWRIKNPEKSKEICGSWYKNNKEKAKQHSRNWKLKNPDRVSNSHRKSNKQPIATRTMPDVCERCEKPETNIDSRTGFPRLLALDHCHETGVFRGWLCAGCNMGIGLLGDNEEGLLKALDYLRRSKNADQQ